MHQVARRLKDGRLELVEAAEPLPTPGTVAVRLEASAISVGTERATLEVARKSLIGKARARPDQTRQVFERLQREGARATLAVVRSRLEELGPLGYSAAGVVIEAGAGVRDLRPGDRVAVGGGGAASHAEVDIVPSLLCARMPEGVDSRDAAFATVGAIALNGFRLAEVGVGSRIAVIGLGIVGQLAVQIATAAGCRVTAIDVAPPLVGFAQATGVEGLERSQADDPRLEGSVDAVLVCAATASDDPIKLAARLARDRATVVAVGDVGLQVPRGAFYDKELALKVARSYGPGRYDPAYEHWGLDYPIGHVRWTEQRNLEAFIQLLDDGRIAPSRLVTHTYPFAEAERAFSMLDASDEPVLGVLLEYGGRAPVRRPPTARRRRSSRSGSRVALIGAGNFATGTLLPALIGEHVTPVVVATTSSLSAESARRRFGFAEATTSAEAVIEREDIDLVVIATRHDSHARLAASALKAGKATYVEKPLALSDADLVRVRSALDASDAPLMVGFNRRYAPDTIALAESLRGPRLVHLRVNAGRVAPGHWINDLGQGGGRLIGEGCHFVDLACHLIPGDPVAVRARGYPSSPDLPLAATDNLLVELDFSDGSAASITYAADAPTEAGKERVEASAAGVFVEIDDFRGATIWRGRKSHRSGRRAQDKGFGPQFAHLTRVVRGLSDPPDPESFIISTLATLAAARSLETGRRELVVTPETESERLTPSHGLPDGVS